MTDAAATAIRCCNIVAAINLKTMVYENKKQQIVIAIYSHESPVNDHDQTVLGAPTVLRFVL